jgi:hypothetical protein
VRMDDRHIPRKAENLHPVADHGDVDEQIRIASHGFAGRAILLIAIKPDQGRHPIP